MVQLNLSSVELRLHAAKIGIRLRQQACRRQRRQRHLAEVASRQDHACPFRRVSTPNLSDSGMDVNADEAAVRRAVEAANPGGG
jgi:hypothetical protein